MRTNLASAAITALALGAAGCVNTTFVRTGSAYAPKADDCEIAVFTAALPDRPYEEIGLIEGEGSLWKADMEDLIPELKAEACGAGGDALILHSAQRYATGEDGVENMYAFATVVKWTG